MATLSDDEVRDGLARLPGWDLSGAEIVKEWTLGSFRDAVAFVVRVSFEAETADHHPDIDIRYNRVRFVLSTHSEGGITAKDLDLAGRIDRIAAAGVGG